MVHETYHTLAFQRGISPADSRRKIVTLIRDRRTSFLNITKTASLVALDLAVMMNLGGRDSLILGTYLQGGIPEMYSHDQDMVKLGKVTIRGRSIRVSDPVA